jgi:DNA-binding GntR family transcriptional regulator
MIQREQGSVPEAMCNGRHATPRQHVEIIEVLKHENRAAAEQAMKRHMEETKSRLLDRF